MDALPPGRKVLPQYDNPIDDLLLRIIDPLCAPLRATGHTPNMLTAYSFIFTVASLYSLYHGHLTAFAVGWALSYFFDCVDGHFARKYGMVTELGDWLDHASDLAGVLGLLVVVHLKYGIPLWAAIALGVGYGLMAMHFGCQQLVYTQHTGERARETLDAYQCLCPSRDGKAAMHFTKFFGPGTMQVILVGATLIIARGK